MAIHSSVIRSLNQPESICKNTQTSTSLFPSAWGQATYVSGRLIVKPRVTSKHPGAGLCSRANILAKVPVPKARVGCNFIHIYPMYANYLKLDTLAGLARSSDKMVSNCFLWERDSQYNSYHLQCIVIQCFWFSAMCDIYCYTIKRPQSSFNIKLENDWGGHFI